ncbi:hypothetical protein YC2023_116356 [Brassica napus]
MEQHLCYWSDSNQDFCNLNKDWWIGIDAEYLWLDRTVYQWNVVDLWFQWLYKNWIYKTFALLKT